MFCPNCFILSTFNKPVDILSQGPLDSCVCSAVLDACCCAMSIIFQKNFEWFSQKMNEQMFSRQQHTMHIF